MLALRIHTEWVLYVNQVLTVQFQQILDTVQLKSAVSIASLSRLSSCIRTDCLFKTFKRLDLKADNG